MRHRKKKTLARGRDINRRRMRQLANSLILQEKIETTAAAGKLVRSLVERLITKGKVDSLHAKRQLFAELSPNAARKVFEVLSPKFKERKGGYTRIVKVPPRKDGNERVLVEILD